MAEVEAANAKRKLNFFWHQIEVPPASGECYTIVYYILERPRAYEP